MSHFQRSRVTISNRNNTDDLNKKRKHKLKDSCVYMFPTEIQDLWHSVLVGIMATTTMLKACMWVRACPKLLSFLVRSKKKTPCLPRLSSFQAMFLSYGPKFQQKTTIEPFSNIELYNVMCGEYFIYFYFFMIKLSFGFWAEKQAREIRLQKNVQTWSERQAGWPMA